MKRRTKKKSRKPQTQALARREPQPVELTLPEAIEQVLIGGDLAPLGVPQRLEFYKTVCKSLGLNPFTKPFEYIVLNGKMVLYARKDCTEQLRKIHRVAVVDSKREILDGLCTFTVTVADKTGRTDTGTGAVPTANLKGVDLANAIMKAETKAKRRATLSICGLGFLDESEIDGVDDYQMVTPGGRIIQENPPENGSKLTSAQQAVVSQQLREADEREKARREATRPALEQKLGQAVEQVKAKQNICEYHIGEKSMFIRFGSKETTARVMDVLSDARGRFDNHLKCWVLPVPEGKQALTVFKAAEVPIECFACDENFNRLLVTA